LHISINKCSNDRLRLETRSVDIAKADCTDYDVGYGIGTEPNHGKFRQTERQTDSSIMPRADHTIGSREDAIVSFIFIKKIYRFKKILVLTYCPENLK